MIVVITFCILRWILAILIRRRKIKPATELGQRWVDSGLKPPEE